MAIPAIAMAYIQRETGLNPKQIFGLDFGGTFEEGIAELAKGSKSKVDLDAKFLFNRTTGTSESKIGRTMDAKSIGDNFTGLIKQVGYSYLKEGLKDGTTREKSINKFINDFSEEIKNVSSDWKDKDNYKRMYANAQKLAKRVQDNKIFQLDGNDILWYDRDSQGRGFDTSKDFSVTMLALGAMYQRLYGLSENPVQLDEDRNVVIKDNVVIRHQEAQHMSAFYGAADKRTSGYALSQGYREHAALNRLIKFVNPEGKTAKNAQGIDRDIAE